MTGDAGERLAAARRSFGDAAAAPQPDPALGDIRLRPEQRAAAARVAALIDRHGGALLADTVGAGKTYVALAVARRFGSVTIAAPAALRAMWHEAMQRTGTRATFVSYERMSRDGRANPGGELVILDEAHHLRGSLTRRYAAATELCRGARVLLVSATPLQNRVRDLAVQLALFLGTRALSLPESRLATYLVRGAAESTGDFPMLVGPRAVTLPVEDDCLDLLVSLPPPVPALDEGDGGALLLYGLVQQWASSRAALIAALRRREARAAALSAILESGRMPSRSELGAWTCADHAVQLAFPELLVAERIEPDALLVAVRNHAAAVRAAVRALTSGPGDPDLARADALRSIRRAHPGERIVAFSQFTETVHALARHLLATGAVACLTARGARIACGSMSREEVVEQFLPGSPSVPAASRIDLLLTTDVLSEGLNLQRASVIVHLDLPWNPARLEQRVGRVRRLGSPHAVVTAYAFSPPASAERLLRLRSRLDAKLRMAGRTVGTGVALLPDSPSAAQRTPGEAEDTGTIAAILHRWRSDGAAAASPLDGGVAVAAVRAPIHGFVALLSVEGEPATIVASLGRDARVPTSAPRVVRRALEACDGPAVNPDSEGLALATGSVAEWWTSRRAADAAGLDEAAATRGRRAALCRLHDALARAPRHERSRLGALAADARRVLCIPMPRAEECSLAELTASPMEDEAWLNAIIAVGATPACTRSPLRRATPDPPLRALILLQSRANG